MEWIWPWCCIHSHSNQAILRHTKVPHIELLSKRLGKTAEMQSEMAKTEGGGQLQRVKLKEKVELSQQIPQQSRSGKGKENGF